MGKGESQMERWRWRWETYGDEEIRHPFLVLGPAVAVLHATALDVSYGAMGDHGGEENGIEPWEGTGEAADYAPAEGEVKIAGVVDLTGVAVPAINEERIAGRGLNGRRILDSPPWELGKGVAGAVVTALAASEGVLLTVRRVPYPVDEEIGDIQEDEDGTRQAIDGRRVVGEVDRAVAVGQRDTSEIPENKHEAPLLVIHVPRRDNELLALGARVGVEEVRHHQETDLAGDVP